MYVLTLPRFHERPTRFVGLHPLSAPLPSFPARSSLHPVMSLARMNNYGAANPHYYQEAAGQICCIVQVGTCLVC